MISFEQFLMDDHSPIYLQIIGYIKRGIASGTIGDGDEMPSSNHIIHFICVHARAHTHTHTNCNLF